MRRSDLYITLLLFFIGVTSRIFLLEKVQSHWDGPQYSIAIIRYSFAQATPALPGYPLYIALGKLINLFISNPHRSLLIISAIGSGLSAAIIYISGTKIFNKSIGIIGSIIFLTGSTFYYFGLTAYAYGLTPATTTLLALFVYLILVKKRNLGIALGLIFGICLGIRPQEVIQIGLLFFVGFLALSITEKMKSIIVFLLVTLIWLTPLLFKTDFLQQIQIQSNYSAAIFPNTSIFNHLELMIKGFLLSFGLSSIFLLYPFYKLIKHKSYFKENITIISFFSAWIIPGIIYNFFIRSDHAGYQMSYLSGILILISYGIWQATKNYRLTIFPVLFIIGSFNLYWFFYNRDPHFIKPYRPTSFHYSDIRKNDLKTGSKIIFIQQKLNPNNTLIVTREVLWRPYMYYLKKFQLIALNGLDSKEGKSQHTRFEAKDWNMREYESDSSLIPIPSYIRFIIFPDDKLRMWIKNYPLKIISLPGNSYVSIINVTDQKKIRYGYHYLEVLK